MEDDMANFLIGTARWNAHACHCTFYRLEYSIVRRMLCVAAEEGRKKRAKPAVIEVYRLLHKNEVSKDLVNQELHILWPDNQTWYAATVTKVSLPLN
jgi:hypothetical protein